MRGNSKGGTERGYGGATRPEGRRIEIVHESLLSRWPRLVRWQTQDAEGAQLRDELRQAAQVWEQHGRSEDYLWSGTAFREYQLWRERYPGGLSELEEAFGEAMTALARRRRRRRRLAVWAVIAALAVGLAVLGALRQEAVVQAGRAEAEAQRSEASRLLALAELRLRDDPTEALAFAIASLEKLDTEEARGFIMKVLWEAPPAFELPQGSQAVRVPAFSPDGRWLAAAGHASDVLVWSQDGQGPLALPGHELTPRGPNRARWASNTLLVTGYLDIGRRVHLWSLPQGRRLRTIDVGELTYWQVEAGRLLAETLESGSAEEPGVALLREWELPGGDAVALGRVDLRRLGARFTFFAPDGRSWFYAKGRDVYTVPLPIGRGPARLLGRLGADILGRAPIGHDQERTAIVDSSGQVAIWSFQSGAPVLERSIAKPETAQYPLFPDGSQRWLAANPQKDSQVRLWDTAAWRAARPLALRRNTSWYGSMKAFHPRGDWVVASTQQFTRLTFWPLAKRRPLVVDGYDPITRPVAFSPDGRWLATSWGDDRLRLWPLFEGGAGDVEVLEVPRPLTATQLVFDPQGRYLLATGHHGRALIVPLDGSAPRVLPGFSEDTMIGGAISASGHRVAAAVGYGPGDKPLRVWDLKTGESWRLEPPVRGGAGGRVGQPVTGSEGGILELAFADESTLYGFGDGGLRRWNLETGAMELVVAAPDLYMAGALDPAGRTALTMMSAVLPAECTEAVLYDLATGASRRLTELGDCGPRRLVLDPSGTVAASATTDGVVRVGRLGEPPHLLVGHRGPVQGIAISPDLRWVATSGDDATLRLWPMPDLTRPPFHTVPRAELLARLRSLTNLRVVEDRTSPTGFKLDVGPFPGWEEVPKW